MIVTPQILQIIGAVIIAAVLLRVIMTLIPSLRGVAIGEEWRRDSLEYVRRRAEAARALSGEERERAALSWNGFRKFEIASMVGESKDVHSLTTCDRMTANRGHHPIPANI